MRLIDADKLYPDCMSNKGLAITQSQLANVPTVEPPEWQIALVKKLYEKARPHGEWQLHGMIYYCSECGHECGESGDNFCGNCGADMRGGRE